MERVIRDTHVCVVGGAGFLGSHLVEHLVEERHCRVLVIDNLVAGRREFVHPFADFEHADICLSETHLRKLFEHYKVEYVFSYAAWPFVPTSFSRPLHVFNVNAVGALNVLNAAQEAGCRGILQVGSAEVFGDQVGSISENSPVTPHSSYGASKAGIDFMCQAAWRERKTPVVVLRQFNCYGPRPLHRYVIPSIVEQLHQHGPLVRLGNNTRRDFQYATAAVEMAVELLEKEPWGEIFNMGSEESIEIYTLAHLVGELMGFSEITIEVDSTRVRPWDIWSLHADCTKLYSLIGKRDRTPFREGLQKTIDWFRQNGNTWRFPTYE